MKRLLGLCLVPMLVSGLETTYAQSVSDSDFLSIEPAVTSINGLSSDTNFHVAVMIDHKTTLAAVAIPLTYAGHPGLHIDTDIVGDPGGSNAQGVTFGPAGDNPAWHVRSSTIEDSTQTIVVGFISFSMIPPSSDTLCYLHFALDYGTGSASVGLDSIGIVANHLAFFDIDAFEYIPQWSPGIIDIMECPPIPLPGDNNCDSSVTSADIIYLVNHVFKGGPAPREGCGF